MYAIRSYYDLDADGAAAEAQGLDEAAGHTAGPRLDLVDDAQERRITSYNVCYTKLLRVGIRFAALLDGRQLGHAGQEVLSLTVVPALTQERRITSYNVCYTKLLRHRIVRQA